MNPDTRAGNGHLGGLMLWRGPRIFFIGGQREEPAPSQAADMWMKENAVVPVLLCEAEPGPRGAFRHNYESLPLFVASPAPPAAGEDRGSRLRWDVHHLSWVYCLRVMTYSHQMEMSFCCHKTRRIERYYTFWPEGGAEEASEVPRKAIVIHPVGTCHQLSWQSISQVYILWEPWTCHKTQRIERLHILTWRGRWGSYFNSSCGDMSPTFMAIYLTLKGMSENPFSRCGIHPLGTINVCKKRCYWG